MADPERKVEIPEVPAPPAERRILRSRDLLAGARQIVIEHHGQEYRLQVTRAGKLILTK